VQANFPISTTREVGPAYEDSRTKPMPTGEATQDAQGSLGVAAELPAEVITDQAHADEAVAGDQRMPTARWASKPPGVPLMRATSSVLRRTRAGWASASTR